MGTIPYFCFWYCMALGVTITLYHIFVFGIAWHWVLLSLVLHGIWCYYHTIPYFFCFWYCMALGITIIGIAWHLVLLSHYTIFFLFLVLHGIGYYYHWYCMAFGVTIPC